MSFTTRHSRSIPWILFVVTLWLTASPCWSADPYLVQDINPGSGDSYISNVRADNGLLFFRAYSAGHGYEPWRSDGTRTGTIMIQELRTGSNSSLPAFFSKLGLDMFFAASNSTGPGIFRTRGEPNDIVLVKESFVLWASTSPMASAGGFMFFSASEVGPLGGDKELWWSDGTPAGTARVKDINPGSAASYPENLVAVGNTLYFSAYDATYGTRLWRSNGSAPGTFLVQRTGLYPSSPIELTQAGDRLFLGAVDGFHGAELWMVEGGIPTVIDIRPGVDSGGTGGIARVGRGACFRSLGDGTTTTGAELWCSDGTDAWKVKEIAPGTTPAYIALITDFDGSEFYFIADDTINGSELWRSDGTESGTWMVKNINESGDGMNGVNSEIVTFCGGIFFSADDGVNGFELWRSDGTFAGTTMVADLNPTGDSYPSHLTVIDDVLLFSAYDPTHGSELWGLDLSLEPCVVCPEPCLFRDSFEWGFTPWSDWSPGP